MAGAPFRTAVRAAARGARAIISQANISHEVWPPPLCRIRAAMFGKHDGRCTSHGAKTAKKDSRRDSDGRRSRRSSVLGGSVRLRTAPSSEEDRQAGNIEKAHRVLQNCDEEYADYVKKKEAGEDRRRMTNQGVALTRALHATFEATLSTAMAATTTLQSLPPPPPPAPSGAAAAVPADELAPTQARLLEAALGTKIPLDSCKRDDVIAVLSAGLMDIGVRAASSRFLGRFQPDAKAPKSKEQKAALLFRAAKKL